MDRVTLENRIINFPELHPPFLAVDLLGASLRAYVGVEHLQDFRADLVATLAAVDEILAAERDRAHAEAIQDAVGAAVAPFVPITD